LIYYGIFFKVGLAANNIATTHTINTCSSNKYKFHFGNYFCLINFFLSGCRRTRCRAIRRSISKLKKRAKTKLAVFVPHHSDLLIQITVFGKEALTFAWESRAIVLCQVLRFSIDNEGDEVMSSNLGKKIKLIFLAKIPKAYFAASAHHNAASACSGRRIAQSAVAKQPWGGKVLITFVMHTIILSAPRMGIHLYASR